MKKVYALVDTNARSLGSDRALRHIVCLSVVILVSCVQPVVEVQRDMEVSTFFSDNMVLQRGAVNTIWGTCHPGRPVWSRYKGLISKTTADRNGNWKLQLDLRKPVDPTPGTLAIGMGRQDQSPVATLTNVAIGDVWLLGVCDGRSVPLQIREGARLDHPEIRFITVSNLSSLRESRMRPGLSWRACNTNSIRLQELSALSFYTAHSLDENYIGIVQAKRDELATGLKPNFVLDPSRREALNRVRGHLQNTWVRTTDEIEYVEAFRAKLISDLGKLGISTNFPRILHYDHFPIPHLREEFYDAKPPASLLSFEGTVW